MVFFLGVILIPTSSAQVKNQNRRILDSLLVLNVHEPEDDSTRLALWVAIQRQYGRVNEEANSLNFVAKIIPLTRQLKRPLIAATVYNRVGLFYHGRTDINNAEKYYLLAIDSYLAGNRKDLAAGSYLNLGALYSMIPDYAKAISVTQKAIEIYLVTGELGSLASCYSNIANIYVDLHQESKAMEYLDKALKIFINNGENTRGVNIIYSTKGMAYLSASQEELRKLGVSPEQRFKISIEFLLKALKISEALKEDDLILHGNLNLGSLYETTGDRARALAAYTKAYLIGKNIYDKNNQAATLLSLGRYYENENNAETSLNYYQEALSIGMSNSLADVQQKSYAGISNAYEQLGDYGRALENYRKFVSVKESVFNEEKEREFTRKQLQIDFAVKEKDYQVKQLKTDGDLQRQMSLAAQQQQLLALRQQKLELSNKEKIVQRLTFLKKEADLQNEKNFQKKVFENSKLSAQLRSAIAERRIFKQGVQIKLDHKVKLVLYLAILLSLIIAVVIYFSQRRTRQLNKIINKQKAELVQLGKVKNKIFSVVSHDMRTPVNSVISFIQLLEGQNLTQEKLSIYAASLKDNLHHTSEMMENLLTWAASQMEGFNSKLGPVDTREVVSMAIEEVSVKAAIKEIKIESSFSEMLTCEADANMLLVVIRNLLNNAVKFTPQGGNISLKASLKGEMVAIEIGDNGVGMTKELVQHFNKDGAFLGGGQSTLGTRNEKGTGLGLMLCRTFTDIMNGTIKVSSEHGKGTTFHLSFKKAVIIG